MAAVQLAQIERSAIRKIAVRLVPFVALMFFINFLDRTAISFAGPNGMARDIGLTAAQFGLAAGVFFIGYIVLEIPSNLALHKFGARRWLARIMVTWGVVALLFTWVNSVGGLYTLRFLLGVAEAGFFPGAILYLSLWVPANHRSRKSCRASCRRNCRYAVRRGRSRPIPRLPDAAAGLKISFEGCF